MLERYRTNTLKSEADKRYGTLTEKQLLQESQALKDEQSEALQILKADAIGKRLLKKYKQLYPSIRGDLGMEEVYSIDVVVAVSEANAAYLEEKLAVANKKLALRPSQAASLPHSSTESPEIDQIFRDATIYDREGERWIVRGITDVEDEKVIEIEGHEGELRTIFESQLKNYTRFIEQYRFPSIVNRNLDIDVWKAKASRVQAPQC